MPFHATTGRSLCQLKKRVKPHILGKDVLLCIKASFDSFHKDIFGENGPCNWMNGLSVGGAAYVHAAFIYRQVHIKAVISVYKAARQIEIETM